MKRPTITVPAKIDAGVFRRFALFETFVRQKRWRSPALFAAILLTAAGVCFVFGADQRGAGLLGAVLALVALGLPAAYVVSFLCSVRKQGKRLGLDGARVVYTLHLNEDGILTTSEKEQSALRWEQIFCAYRVEGCIYLYATPRQAFLLPEDGQGDAVWTLMTRQLPAEKCVDRR